MLNTIYNEDCQTGIKRIPDNYVDLVIIDTPYLINNHNTAYKSELSKYINSYKELSKIREENEILKKAIAIFTQK